MKDWSLGRLLPGCLKWCKNCTAALRSLRSPRSPFSPAGCPLHASDVSGMCWPLETQRWTVAGKDLYLLREEEPQEIAWERVEEGRGWGRRSGRRHRQVRCSPYAAVSLGNQLKHHEKGWEKGLESEARVPACKGAVDSTRGWDGALSLGDGDSLKGVHQENGIIKCAFRQLVLMTVWKAIKEWRSENQLRSYYQWEDEELSQATVTRMCKRAEKILLYPQIKACFVFAKAYCD